MHIGQITVELFVGLLALLVLTKILGKTQIDQLTPFDFISALILGELVGNSVYDPEVKVWSILYAVSFWGLLIFLIEKLTMKIRGTRRVLEGAPSVVIRKGILDRKELKGNNVSIDELQQMLRQQKDIFSLREVEYAILEPNGKISAIKKSKYADPTIEDLKIKQKAVYIPVSLISDGKVVHDNLKLVGFDENWLLKQIRKKDILNFEDVLYAEWKKDEGFFCWKMDQ
ncbi:DUF421 domain-containing protein [Sporosarcina sp. HYO08]|uniref:YetF domain-containing protein n=1 Tax=Sporosarcina sp. HYO08 TaxID=1759557 RepID=UPI0007970032|nr:DUF421 domain-containing protein [Sporosarcina sp. HYO08]KXH84032.1 hypothetical protein AU377_04570 [Sporosarcina sp. HYO08]